MGVGGVEDHRSTCIERPARAATSTSVASERERDDEEAGRVDLGLERRRDLERDEDRVAEPFSPTNAAIVAIATVETTAIRSPPMIAGRASGSSTRVSI